MTNFKAGDKVKIITGCNGNAKNGETRVGETYTLVNEFVNSPYAGGCSCQEKWQLIDDHPFKVGDEIVDAAGSEATIKETLSNSLAIQWNTGNLKYLTWFSLDYAKENGWKLKDSPEEVEELTLADVCKELGRDVKIKK